MTLETDFFSTEILDFPTKSVFSSHLIQCFGWIGNRVMQSLSKIWCHIWFIKENARAMIKKSLIMYKSQRHTENRQKVTITSKDKRSTAIEVSAIND